jgi:SPP1 gp7 family putative phage head morphogenesis protein
MNYETELPNNVKKEFGKNIFGLQFDKLITEIIRESLIYADKTMKKMSAAKVNESYILTEEAVRISQDLSKEASESIVRILQDDAIYYEHPKALSKRIVDLWGGEKYRAERFARTFTADVATATTVARYRQYGVRYMEFDAEIDDRTTDQCRCLNGVQFDLEKESVDKYRPPLHMHCLVAGTLVKTLHMNKRIEDLQIGDLVLTHKGRYMPITATMSRIPEELIEVSTGKRTIRITPNHPIYTERGGVMQWIAAGELTEEDDLVIL